MNWQLLDHDRELFERELNDFLPPRIFDAHAHLYDQQHSGDSATPIMAQGPAPASFVAYQKHIAELTPGRQTSALFFPFPTATIDIEAANRFLRDESRRDPNSRGQMLIKPEMNPEYIRQTARRDGFVGLKCYHLYAAKKPTFDALLPSYLPEEQVRMAHEEGLSITIHLVRARAMADPHNQEVLRAWGKKYPNARFILAHAARGFNPYHTIEGIGALKGLRNIWCDTSAVCDGGAFEAIIQTLGVDRLLYGSDFPLTHWRGRSVAIGDSFLWVSEANSELNAAYGTIRPTLIGLESLRTLKTACRNLKLTDNEVQAIFYDNAAALYNL